MKNVLMYVRCGTIFLNYSFTFHFSWSSSCMERNYLNEFSVLPISKI
jgi:hypothetical protein